MSLFLSSEGIVPLNETQNGKPFFRKIYWPGDDGREQTIAKILQKQNHPNIVTQYRVTPSQIDMELLDPEFPKRKQEIYKAMKPVKTFLQSIGIYQIDWKADQLGRSADGQIKLYDFNLSVLVDPTTQKIVYGFVHNQEATNFKEEDDEIFSIMIGDI